VRLNRAKVWQFLDKKVWQFFREKKLQGPGLPDGLFSNQKFQFG
jgi:hypothetical protein